MILYFSIFIISKIILSESVCVAGEKNCLKCHPNSKLCIKCDKDIYSPDSEGGCVSSKKCQLGKNHCNFCSEDGKTCKECDVGYFPDENGACSLTENCEISYIGQCLKCKENFVLIGTQSHYQAIDDYIKICKPLNSDDLLNCRSISYDKGICMSCQDGYYYSYSDKKCTKDENCEKSSFGVCKECKSGYYLDKKQQKCIWGTGTLSFSNCKISNNGSKCDECYDDYYFDQEGKCVHTNYCSKGQGFKCEMCIDGYYLTEYGKICTTEKNCYSGRKDIGICTHCKDNFCIDFHDGKCKSNQENNEFLYCTTADGKCKECIYGKYLGQDQKCSNSINCAIAEKGECTKCIDNYYLGLDKKCSSVEHCIYTDNYFNCIECDQKFYYDKSNMKCKAAEGNFENCKSGFDGKYCELCKEGFYINKNDNLCYSNKEKNEFYNCEISNGNFCTKCIEGYYLGYSDNKCTKAENCDIIENENRCLFCEETYCLDAKTGLCEDNDIINDEEKLYYFRCNKTNSEATECEVCLEGYELRDGLCFDEQHCIERNIDGTCKKCQKFEDEYYEQCLNNIFGCVEAYFDENCLECNDLSDVGGCTGCMEGFELDSFQNCVEIDEIK